MTPSEEQVIDAVREVFDPEVPVNIWDMGLIYGIKLGERTVDIDMTLTSPSCPVAESLPLAVVNAVKNIAGDFDVHVEIVWDPPWTPDKMTDAAKLQLGME